MSIFSTEYLHRLNLHLKEYKFRRALDMCIWKQGFILQRFSNLGIHVSFSSLKSNLKQQKVNDDCSHCIHYFDDHINL